MVGQQVRQRAALALQQLDDGVADLVDLVAVEALEHRPQSAQQRVEIQRGLGVAACRWCAPGGQLAQFAWAGGDLQVPVADQVLVADDRPVEV